MRLVHQITAAILATLLAVVALVAASMYLSVARGFSRYVRGLEEARLEPAVQRLTAFYAKERSWDALAHDPRRFGELLRREDRTPPPPAGRQRSAAQEPPPDARREPPPQPRREALPEPAREPPPRAPRGPPREEQAPERRDTDPLELSRRVSLFDVGGRRVMGEGALEEAASRIALTLDGATVGWLGVRAIPGYETQLDLGYLRQVRAQLAWIATAALVLGLLAGWLLARRLVRPIDALRAGMHRLATGDFAARVHGQGSGEFGQLGRDFGTLAEALAGAEKARRQWVADTSHELRTPIAVLRAETEAMLDGVRPADAAALGSLHAELLRLGKLVDDLGELARADRGGLLPMKLPVEPVALLRESVELFRGRLDRRRLTAELDLAPAEGARIAGEAERLQQVFSNLLENSARYTDEGGRLRISARLAGRSIVLTFDDSPPGVAPEALPRLFERFYRADSSRSRESGGSGLGLSICQRLVQAHGGTIAAAQSPLGGLRVELAFPLLLEEAGRRSSDRGAPADSTAAAADGGPQGEAGSTR